MTIKSQLEQKIYNLDETILKRHPNNIERKIYIRTIMTDDILKWLYCDNGLSANNINKLYYEISNGLIKNTTGYIIHRLKENNITTRNIQQTCYLDSVRSQKSDTIMVRYGVSNISQIPDVKIKKSDTCYRKYGVSNNFKSSVIKQKIRDYYRTNFGVDHISEIRGCKQAFKLSKPHREVNSILEKYNVPFEFEQNKYFKSYNNVLQRNYRPVVDTYIPLKKLVLEIFGVYWHAKPTIYKSTDLFHTVYGKLTAEEIWSRDKIKIDHLRNMGYNIEIIWSDEINETKILEILNKYEDQKN